MDEDDVLQNAANWYVGVLGAVQETFKGMGIADPPERMAAVFVQGLRQQGYMIEKAED